MNIIQLSSADNVALALTPQRAGDVIADSVIVVEPVEAGHKVALRAIKAGTSIYKYGQVIGLATRDIRAGEHVHIHNVSAEITADPSLAKSPVPHKGQPRMAHFQGYVRADGRTGTRNYIGIVTSVNCSATVARKIASSFPDGMFENEPQIDGVVAITHSTGCGMASQGEGADTLARTLAGYANHPNFAGVLFLGLGCEVAQIPNLLKVHGLVAGERLRTLTIQEAGGTLAAVEKGKGIVRELIELARTDRRQSVSAANLVLGLQCGGSDGWSGITANPALGRAADFLVAVGGTAILSETPEIWGAEQLLYARAETEEVRAKLKARLDWWQSYMTRHGAEFNNNPSPGNIRGGLTTILEKSLGAVAKSGRSALRDVYLYAEPIRSRGFVFMDSPGYDPCSATGQTASGANILAFTTGRGSVFGSKPAPCIKLASNARLAADMPEDMDIDCSGVLEGRTLDAVGEEIFQVLLETASGRKSKSEELGMGDLEFVPWQLGAVV